MKNSFINKVRSKIKINIKGKNIERFINKLIKNKIDIISLERVKYNEINLIIYQKDLKLIDEIKTIYELDVIRNYGFINIKKILNKNKYIFIFIFISVIFLYILSNLIFSVEIIHSDKDIRNIIKNELKNNGIEKFKFKKNYKEKEKIKKYILNKYKDKIEWLEIKSVGTKYIIRVEERMITNEKELSKNRDLIAKKNGIIISVEASRGDIIKNRNDYVKRGDVIISGNITLNNEIKNQVSAKGKVYAETWYTINLKYPYHYKKIEKTTKTKTIYTIKFLNKYYDIFNFHKYKNKQIKNKILFKNNYIPFYFIKQKQYEINVIDKIYDRVDVIDKGINEAKRKLLKKINNSKILYYKIIDKKYYNNYVELNIFFSVKEDITDYKIIEKDTILN